MGFSLTTFERPRRGRGCEATKRLTVGLAFKDGVNVDTISERYGIPQSTIDDWLDRFENRPTADALRDDPRSGRPSNGHGGTTR